jgi:hypothetical protein
MPQSQYYAVVNNAANGSGGPVIGFLDLRPLGESKEKQTTINI